jgi:hypothetical protein
MTINRKNYEEYLMLYNDNELDVHQQEAVEKFIAENPELYKELALLQNIKLPADTEIVFTDKSSLYRHGKSEKVIPLFRWWYAAAAIVINSHSSQNIPLKIADRIDNTEKTTIDQKPLQNTGTITENKPEDINSPSKLKEAIISPEAPGRPSGKDVLNNKAVAAPEERMPSVRITENAVNDKVSGSAAPAEMLTPAPPEAANNNIAIVPGQTGEIKVNAVMPERLDALVINTATTPVAAVEQAETGTSANYIETKKNSIKGFLRKASRIIEKTAELRNTQEVSVRLGNLEIALH